MAYPNFYPLTRLIIYHELAYGATIPAAWNANAINIIFANPNLDDYFTGFLLHELMHTIQFRNQFFIPDQNGQAAYIQNMVDYHARNINDPDNYFPSFNNFSYDFLDKSFAGFNNFAYDFGRFYQFLFSFEPPGYNPELAVWATNYNTARNSYISRLNITVGNIVNQLYLEPMGGYETLRSLADAQIDNGCGAMNDDETKEDCVLNSISNVIDGSSYSIPPNLNWYYYYPNATKQAWLAFFETNWWGRGQITRNNVTYTKFTRIENIDVTTYKTNRIVKYHPKPYTASFSTDQYYNWVSEGFYSSSSQQPITIIVRGQTNNYTDGIQVYIDSTLIGTISFWNMTQYDCTSPGSYVYAVNRVRSEFFQTTVGSGWHSINLKATGSPSVSQVNILKGTINPVMRMSKKGTRNITSTNSTCQVNFNSSGDYIVDGMGVADPLQYCNINKQTCFLCTNAQTGECDIALGEVLDRDTDFWVQIGNQGGVYQTGFKCSEDGYKCNEVGFASVSGNEDTPMIYKWPTLLSYNSTGAFRWVANVNSGQTQVKVMMKSSTRSFSTPVQHDVTVWDKPTLNDLVIYPKAEEIFNLYFMKMANYETIYIHPLVRTDYSLNWLNLQSTGQKTDIFASRSTNCCSSSQSQGCWEDAAQCHSAGDRAYGPLNFVIQNQNETNLLWTIVSGSYDTYVKVILN